MKDNDRTRRLPHRDCRPDSAAASRRARAASRGANAAPRPRAAPRSPQGRGGGLCSPTGPPPRGGRGRVPSGRAPRSPPRAAEPRMSAAEQWRRRRGSLRRRGAPGPAPPHGDGAAERREGRRRGGLRARAPRRAQAATPRRSPAR